MNGNALMGWGRRVSAVAGSLALGLTLCFGLGGTLQAAKKPIKVGYVGGLSGACATLTDPAVKGMKLATKEINASGGILGRPVEVIYRDSKTKPDEGAKQARDLILSEHVNVLTGPCSSSIYMAVAPIAEQYHVPLFSALAGSHRATIDFGGPYVYETQPHTLMEGKALAEFAAKKKNWKRIVTMGLDYEWGRVTVGVFVKELKKLRPDVKIVKQLWPPVGESNLTSYITAALAENPDVVMTVMFGGGTVSMIKQGKAYGFLQRTKMIAFLPTDSLMSLGTQIPDGIYGWARAPFYALHNKRAQAFIKHYRAAYHEYPADWAILGHDVMYIIRDGMDKAHSTNPLKLRAALAKLTFPSLRGPLHMRELDNTFNSPVFLGVTKKTPAYPFPIMVDVDRIPGNLLMPPPSVVRKMRAEAKKG